MGRVDCVGPETAAAANTHRRADALHYRYISITAMKEYAKTSFDELRVQDYILNSSNKERASSSAASRAQLLYGCRIQVTSTCALNGSRGRILSVAPPASAPVKAQTSEQPQARILRKYSL